MKRRRFVTVWDDRDVITWVLRAVSEIRPGVDLLEVERAARSHWGGSRPYVAKRTPITANGDIPGRTARRWNQLFPRQR